MITTQPENFVQMLYIPARAIFNVRILEDEPEAYTVYFPDNRFMPGRRRLSKSEWRVVERYPWYVNAILYLVLLATVVGVIIGIFFD